MLIACSSSASAITALIDMGTTGVGNVTGTVSGVTYNDLSIGAGAPDTGPIPVVLNGAVATTVPVPLLTTSNTLSGWTIALTLISTGTAGEWGNNGALSNDLAAPYPAALVGIEANALKDNLYMNRDKRGRFTVAGLDDGKTYNILFYGSGEGGAVGDNDQNLIPVTGTGVDFVSTAWNSRINTTTVVEWDDVAPVGGIIALDHQADREGWMNFMSIAEVTAPPAANTYATWIAGYEVDESLAGFDQDADGDGVENGVENFFGTNPGVGSSGLIAGASSGNTFTFTHPQNATPADGLTAAYRWSKDLTTFRNGGQTDGNGTTVNFNPVTHAGIATVTATVTGTARLFVDVKVTQN